MDSNVKTRATHYETLGVSPGASDEEIAQAFAAELRRPRVFGGLAEVAFAYEVLRDPAKRAIYDDSLGLKAKPEAEPEADSPPAVRWEQTPYFVRATPHPAADALSKRAPPREPPFIAAPRVETPQPEPEAEQQLECEAEPQPAPPPVKTNPDYLIAIDPALGRPSERQWHDLEHRPATWKRAAANIGGLVLGVAILGAVVGLEAGNDSEAQEAQHVVTVALPKPRAPVEAMAATPTPASAPALAPWAVETQTHVPAAVHRPARAPVAAQEPSAATQLADSEPAADAPDPAGADPLAPKPAAEVAASMPLPGPVIARTISRIGYPCGEVASTSTGDGPGVFKVTCTSGHSYRAAPVGGRYRFKRWGR